MIYEIKSILDYKYNKNNKLNILIFTNYYI
jgi:hypothetical protein